MFDPAAQNVIFLPNWRKSTNYFLVTSAGSGRELRLLSSSLFLILFLYDVDGNVFNLAMPNDVINLIRLLSDVMCRVDQPDWHRKILKWIKKNKQKQTI